MKPLTSITFSLAVLSSLAVQAQTDAPPPAPESQAVVSAPAQPLHLPYGVDDVLKLAHAKVGEEVIAAFVQNSGVAYSLRANDIVYLRDQGVTDHVISIMLSQKAAVPAAPAPAAPSQPYQPPSTPPPQEYPQYGGDYVQPASSTYVIPYPTAAYPYYSSYYYSSYYPYYGYGYCGYPYRYGYGYCGYPYRYGYGHGYYGHGLTAVHAGIHAGIHTAAGVHSGFTGAGVHSGFTAIGGSHFTGGHGGMVASGGHVAMGGGGGVHMGGMMAHGGGGGGGHFGGGGGGHMGGGGHR